MTLNEISALRLVNQQIANPEFTSPKELVSWLGAMQAQDFLMSEMAVGLRLANGTRKMVEDAFNKGEILRTHVMRPTWHFVPGEDIYWMLDLTAGRIKSGLKSRHRQLEITQPLLHKALGIFEKMLFDNLFLTREELAVELHKEKINTSENRLSHLLFSAELESLICSGPLSGKKQTYSLLQNRISKKKLLTKEESLAELALRYFSSHGPATVKDFAWWSGLLVKEANDGLQAVKANFVSEVVNYEPCWFLPNLSNHLSSPDDFYLLPAYDEFLISYKNRSASILEVDFKKAISENGIFRSILVIDGHVCGLWKPLLKKDTVYITLEPFDNSLRINESQLDIFKKRLETFYSKKVEITR